MSSSARYSSVAASSSAARPSSSAPPATSSSAARSSMVPAYSSTVRTSSAPAATTHASSTAQATTTSSSGSIGGRDTYCCSKIIQAEASAAENILQQLGLNKASSEVGSAIAQACQAVSSIYGAKSCSAGLSPCACSQLKGSTGLNCSPTTL
ncbi:hypothetical protein FB45DRAFT_886802 [Roridomyces roridus]|uniref:Hydrophobin n=1 Tax=Roridomyces roridus TaxID=1738132 RepID=A0AAD7CIN5_9AGAR|nr:hypothetical protein FB45DRAFT_886802 [Roridomyces roridus]